MTKIPIQDYIDKKTMPRTIFKSNANYFIGCQVTIYCNHCKQRLMSTINNEGKVYCPECGRTPKNNNVTLSIDERRKLVNKLFAKGSDLDEYLLDLMEEHGQCIEDLYAGKLGKVAAKQMRFYFDDAFSVLDDCAFYFMTSPDAQDGKVYSEAGLRRKDFRKDRKVNSVHYDSFISKANDEGKSLTDLVDAIANSYHDKYFTQHYSQDFNVKEFIEPLVDMQEKTIVYLLYIGHTKTEIQAILSLTEAQLKTVIGHIAKNLTTPLVQDNRVKECSYCHQVKIVSDFGKDDRNKATGLKSQCKACDLLRKKQKRLHEIQRNVA